MTTITALGWASAGLTIAGPVVAGYFLISVIGTKAARDGLIGEVRAAERARMGQHKNER